MADVIKASMITSEDRPFVIVCVVGTILLNAVIFGYLYGKLETKVEGNIQSLTVITQDFKTVPERLARIETILQQLVDR